MLSLISPVQIHPNDRRRTGNKAALEAQPQSVIQIREFRGLFRPPASPASSSGLPAFLGEASSHALLPFPGYIVEYGAPRISSYLESKIKTADITIGRHNTAGDKLLEHAEHG